MRASEERRDHLRRRLLAGAAGLLALLAAGPVAAAQLSLPHVFGDHMVLQRERPLPVWGHAAHGASVGVSLRDAEGRELAQASALADATGAWRLDLPPQPAGGPLQMLVRSEPPAGAAPSAAEQIVFEDVLVGEVWFCSGQSNMEWELHLEMFAAEQIPLANHPRLRLLHVPRRPAGLPLDDFDGAWTTCTPQTAEQFSALSYYFGVRVLTTLDVPVGLISASYGGTAIEAWSPREAFDSDPALVATRDAVREADTAWRASLGATLPPLRAWAAEVRAALVADGDGTVAALVPDSPPLPSHPLASARQPTGLWNGMVAAIPPYAVRGVLWYQGEQNIGEGMLYLARFRALVASWRAAWQQPDLPFGTVQIAPFRYGNPPEHLAELREAQRAALALPGIGMVVTTDLGVLDDIHPTNKRDVGGRLARWALAEVYGHDLPWSGPLVRAARRDGARVRVSFDHAAGLATRDGLAPDWFELAGADGRFVTATAAIEGLEVIVSSPEVAQPAVVRFGFHQEAQPNLVNGAKLPASPFRLEVSAP